MKKLLLFVLCFVQVGFCMAQMALPLDPEVRYGKLDNGLTYYIRHNEWPEKRADFYIAQKVGSIQEEENQRGLAHFLEHMCFNGTKNFPGNKLKTYLEGIGVKFGEDLNAYTAFDQTVYNMNNVPVITHPGAIDTCLLILHDWSHDLLLEDKEIDKERGVIEEEWRLRSGTSPTMRMLEKGLPTLLKGSKYAERLPIGLMDVVKNFKYEDLRSYYRKWYRPDMQAIIVVGDVNVDEVEAKIKAIFADIKKVENGAPRELYPIPDNKEPLIYVEKDKELSQSLFIMAFKQDPVPDEIKSNIAYLAMKYALNAMGSMIYDRFKEVGQKANPPFIGASWEFENVLGMARSKDAEELTCRFSDDKFDEAFKATYREYLRVKRHGFTVSEYERFKADYKSSLENLYKKKDKIYNSSFVSDYVDHFLDCEPATSIEFHCETMKMLADQLSIDMLNQMLMEKCDSNIIMTVFMPEKEGVVLPEEAHIVALMKEVEAENIEAYKEEVSAEPLVDAAILKGSKVKSIEPAPFESQLITLKNGIKIYVKKTDFTPNSITATVQSWGGNSLYGDDDLLNLTYAADVMDKCGWGSFSDIELTKKLAGKQVSVSPNIGVRTEGISGSCVTKDFETLLQLIYLNFTAPRQDEEAFRSTVDKMKAMYKNIEMQPMFALQDTLISTLYNNNIRAKLNLPKVKDIETLDYARIQQLYKERFADGDDFTFYFVGDINVDSVKPLLEKYLGSIPVKKGAEKYNTIDLKMTDGDIVNIFEKEQETPFAVVAVIYHSPMKETLKSIQTMSILEQVLNYKYIESVREDEGGAYTVQTAGNIQDYPQEQAIVQVVLPTAPDKRQKMTEIIYKGINELVEKGPSDEDMEKAKEYMLRSHDENVMKNGYWMSRLVEMTTENKDYVTDYEDVLDEITAADIQQMAKDIFRSGNRIEIGMTTKK